MIQDRYPEARAILLEDDADGLRSMLERDLDPNSADRYGDSLLHIAARRGLADCVSMLLEAGANPALRDSEGWTPLHGMAARKSWGMGEDATMALLLLALPPGGTEITGEMGNTPMHEAARLNNPWMIGALAAAGGLTDTYNHDGETPLRVAAWEGREDACLALASLGADPVFGDIYGRPLLDGASDAAREAVAEGVAILSARMDGAVISRASRGGVATRGRRL